MTEFKLIYNLKGKMLDICKKTFLEDGYEVVSNEISNILLLKKGEDNLNVEQIDLILKTAKSRSSVISGILIVDITEAVQFLIEKEKERPVKAVFRWKLRDLILREKSKKEKDIYNESQEQYKF